MTEVGWLVDFDRARLVFDPPRPLSHRQGRPGHAKAVEMCPAIHEQAARTFEILCPYDLRLRIENLDAGIPRLVNVRGPMSAMSARNLNALVVLMARECWRDPQRPVLQIAAPWRFVADEPVWMSQLPPYAHYREPPWPGLVLSGRFPIHIWPRILMWAFEWHDPAQELRLRRGEPWFYVHFESGDPAQSIRLVEASMTPELREYCQGIDGVAGFIRGTHALYKTAAERRPASLLCKRNPSQT